MQAIDNGKIVNQKVPMRNAMNEVTRIAYVNDCAIGVKRWNRLITKFGFEELQLSLPSTKFRRNIGLWANLSIDPKGKFLEKNKYTELMKSWIPSELDKSFIKSLMIQEIEPGKTASWIGLPKRGINNQSLEYDYVDIN